MICFALVASSIVILYTMSIIPHLLPMTVAPATVVSPLTAIWRKPREPAVPSQCVSSRTNRELSLDLEPSALME